MVSWFLGFLLSSFLRFITTFEFHVFWKILIPYSRCPKLIVINFYIFKRIFMFVSDPIFPQLCVFYVQHIWDMQKYVCEMIQYCFLYLKKICSNTRIRCPTGLKIPEVMRMLGFGLSHEQIRKL